MVITMSNRTEQPPTGAGYIVVVREDGRWVLATRQTFAVRAEAEDHAQSCAPRVAIVVEGRFLQLRPPRSFPITDDLARAAATAPAPPGMSREQENAWREKLAVLFAESAWRAAAMASYFDADDAVP